MAKVLAVYLPVAEGGSISTSKVLPAVSNASVCNFGLPGDRLPSSATKLIDSPTIDGT